MWIYKERHLNRTQRFILLWFFTALTLGLLVLMLPGISFQYWTTAILVVTIIGLCNALMRPILIAIKLPPSLFIFGFTTLAINGLMIWILGELLPGYTVIGIWTLLLATSGVSAINITFSDLLAIDDDDSYFHHVASIIVNIYGKPAKDITPGVLFLEVDGLAEPILKRAIRDGYMPTLARWLETGSHKIIRWECDLSSQTSASQAGILHGDNFDIPAFRWYEKDTGKQMTSNHPLDTIELERRISNGCGLLANCGASRSNLFSGDAPQTMFTFSTLGNFSRHRSQDFYPLYMGPYNFFRLLLLFLWELFVEFQEARYQRRHDVQPRIHRGGSYPVLRASTTILMRELNIYILIGDMYAGIPCVYSTFFGYDEVAHHSGVERPDAIEVLKKLDEQFNRLEKFSKFAPRPYKFVILSDHGQSQGATFKQRYGMTLEGLVRRYVSRENSVESIESQDAAWGNLGVFFTDILNHIIPGDNHLISRLFRRAVEPYRHLDQIVLGPYKRYIETRTDTSATNYAQIVVLASGNLGLIYFTNWKERLSYEKINNEFPDLIQGLIQHEGIGFIMVHSIEFGPIAISNNGTYYLRVGKVEGENPLVNFGHHVGAHLLRTDSFPHAPDILVNSFYDPETDEVAAFEELVGSHGGLGGSQTSPFIMFPSEWKIENKNIVGARDLHNQLKKWLAQYQPT